jgi:anti-sigma regulatory factor (Ser/Thr protein kinase)
MSVSHIRGRRPGVPRASERQARLNASWPAAAHAIPEVREAVSEFATTAGVGGEQLEAIKVAASEALTNIVLYAYPARFGLMHVTAELAGGELWLLIADSGCGLHAGREGEGLGLGLALIAELSDGFSVVERSSGGTELRMRFDLDG